MQIASSLDGQSTTEYEILDGISSKGSIKIDELSLDEESLSTSCQASTSVMRIKTMTLDYVRRRNSSQRSFQ
jgi:hypothetical protein